MSYGRQNEKRILNERAGKELKDGNHDVQCVGLWYIWNLDAVGPNGFKHEGAGMLLGYDLGRR